MGELYGKDIDSSVTNLLGTNFLATISRLKDEINDLKNDNWFLCNWIMEPISMLVEAAKEWDGIDGVTLLGMGNSPI